MVQNSSARRRSVYNEDNTGVKGVRIFDELCFSQDSRLFDTRKSQ